MLGGKTHNEKKSDAGETIVEGRKVKIHLGPQGGLYYVDKSGNKKYLKRSFLVLHGDKNKNKNKTGKGSAKSK